MEAGRFSDAEDADEGAAGGCGAVAMPMDTVAAGVHAAHAEEPPAAEGESSTPGGTDELEESEDGWDEEWEDAEDSVVGQVRHTVAKSESLACRFDSLISLEPLRGTGMSLTAGNSLSRTEKKAAQAKHTGLTRDERATTEHVLDPRTRLLLFKLLNSGVISQINGCVSTGKEANVYHAFGRDEELAIKVYKTSVLTFKDRDRYVSGEFRWRHGYCRSNPRKMVRMWAEKEMRNYRRLSEAGVVCPTPLLLREHVLLMSFIGRDGYAAPRLKDATLSGDDASDACRQVMLILRTIFNECRLVHADFSEYNLLWYDRQVVVIDVSQAVEHDHPNALVFLRKDCENAILFFRRCGVRELPTLQQLFTFVTDPCILKGEEGTAYEQMLREASEAVAGSTIDERGSKGAWADGDGSGSTHGAEAEALVEERVFAQMHIPRTLGELPLMQIEKDIKAARGGQGGTLAYARLNGFNADLSVAGTPAAADERVPTNEESAANSVDSEGSDSESEGEESDEDDSEAEEGEQRERYIRRRMARLHHFEDKDEKKDRKQAAKEAKREARANKTPKHVKKAKKKGQKRG